MCDLISFDVRITVITLTASQTTLNEILDLLYVRTPLSSNLAVFYTVSLRYNNSNQERKFWTGYPCFLLGPLSALGSADAERESELVNANQALVMAGASPANGTSAYKE